MEKTKLEIQPDGKTAKTLNRYGKKPDRKEFNYREPNQWFNDRTNKWQQAEQERKTYVIEGCDKQCDECHCENPCLEPGTTHDAIINEETKTCRIV